MSLANVNARKLHNNAILVDFHKDGKRFEMAFESWDTYVQWLQNEIDTEAKAKVEVAK